MTPADEASPLELTWRAVLAGCGFGLIFGAANAYLGLRVGLTVSTSIPIAVLTVALFRAFPGRPGTLLEANLSQTIGSASSSLASGTIFTIPALFLWGMVPPLWQVATLGLLGGILGTAAMIPLRRLLIVKSAAELPYPEGTACAQVLKAAMVPATAKSPALAASVRYVFWGLAIGALVKLAIGGAVLIGSELAVSVPVIPKGILVLEIAPALLGVGYILGYRQSAIMVSGSLISAVVLIPLIAAVGAGLTTPMFPETEKTIAVMTAGEIWSRYIRYIGAGAVAAAGILTVVRSIPTMYASMAAVLRDVGATGVSGTEAPRTDRDLPAWIVLGAPVFVVIVLFAVPGLLAGNMAAGPRFLASLGVAIFGLAFVVVASRIVGLIGVSSNPTSAMTIVTLLGVSAVFAALGWNDSAARAAVLTVGTVVCVAASIAGDTSQDLKTGYLVQATPAWQQLGQLAGVITSCWVVAATVLVLGHTYGYGSADMPAPQATLMKTVIDGVLAGSLPWGLVGTGAALTLCAMLTGIPGLSFAVGLYLPLGTLLPIFVGGCVRRWIESWRPGPEPESEPGVLGASGLIAGEGLAGVLIAGLVAMAKQWPDDPWSQALTAVNFGKKNFAHIGGLPGAVMGALVVAAIGYWLYRAGRSADATSSSVPAA
jgi:putative OPT family oligopeptide transporter